MTLKEDLLAWGHFMLMMCLMVTVIFLLHHTWQLGGAQVACKHACHPIVVKESSVDKCVCVGGKIGWEKPKEEK